MIEIVINFSPQDDCYKIYEPTTQNLIMSQNLAEGLVILNTFLKSVGMVDESKDIISIPEISYHLDGWTMRAIIESNMTLMTRLRNAPTAFQNSTQKFGGSSTGTSGFGTKQKDSSSQGWKSSKGGYSKGGNKKFTPRGSGTFSGAHGFHNANKRFGNKK